jgi:hypothetical protein
LDSPEIASRIAQLKLREDDLLFILGVARQSGAPDFAPAPVEDSRSSEERAATLVTPDLEKALEELRTTITEHYRVAISQARNDVAKELTGADTDSPMRKAVLKAARTYFYGFQEFDAVIFPITYGTDVGELIPVDVLRISPEDAIAIQDESKTGWPKLAGASFGAFGAFLERVWRTNDILWGRLDGAERIIRALAGQGPQADGLIRRAHDLIIAEELTPDSRQEICQMLLDALLRTGADGATPSPAARRTVEEIEQCVRAATGSTDVNPKLLAVLRGALGTDDLRKALETFEISREPNRKTTLENLARSTRIMGRMLDAMGDKLALLKQPGAVLVQAGGALWGMVEVATPGSVWGSFFRYWFALLMLFSIVMIAGGTIFSEPVQSLGFRLLVLALATRLTVSVLHTYIQGRKRWKRALEAIFVIALLALLVLGMIELQRLYEAAHLWLECHFS